MSGIQVKKMALPEEQIAKMYAEELGVNPDTFLADARKIAEKEKKTLTEAVATLYTSMRRMSATILPLTPIRFRTRETDGKLMASFKAATLVSKEFAVRIVKAYADNEDDAKKQSSIVPGTLLSPGSAFWLHRQDQTPIVSEELGNKILGVKFLEPADESAVEKFSTPEEVRKAYVDSMKLTGERLENFTEAFDAVKADGLEKIAKATHAFEKAKGVVLSELRIPEVTEGHSKRVDFEAYREHKGGILIGGVSAYFDDEDALRQFVKKNTPPFEFESETAWTPTVKTEDGSRKAQTDILGQEKLGIKGVSVTKVLEALEKDGLFGHYNNVLDICDENSDGYMKPMEMTGKRVEFQQMMFAPFLWINAEQAYVTEDGRPVIPVVLLDEKGRHIAAKISGNMALRFVGVSDTASFKRVVGEYADGLVKSVFFFGSRTHRKSGDEGKTAFNITLSSIHKTDVPTDADIKTVQKALSSAKSASPAKEEE